MVVFSSAAILLALMSERVLRSVAVAAVLLPWIVGGVLDAVDWTSPIGSPVKTTILQAGIQQEQKWLVEQLLPTMAYYRNATARAADSELIVWPEIAIPTRMWQADSLTNFLSIMRKDTLKRGQAVAFGVFQFKEENGERQAFNSIALLERDQPLQYYHKRHLVPFGEYFPVPDFVLGWMEGLELGLGNISAGAPGQALLTTTSGLRFASVICYEDAYGAEQLYAFPDAGLIINVSNDAWFGDSIAPHQHLQIARMRSLETGRPTVRSTNNGISAFIDEKGRIEQRGPQFQQSRMTRDVQPFSGATPYVRSGNWSVLVLSFVLLGFFWIRSRASL
jgi:apolipoprotein N-acyltransferase